MFMFYEIALIPMYLLIGVWGSGRKEYAAMKLTLMLMGGSAFLLIGILGIYFGSGATTMNLLEIAQLHNIPLHSNVSGSRLPSSGSVCWVLFSRSTHGVPMVTLPPRQLYPCFTPEY